MPTFKSYVSTDGYYINARPSDVGNVTYQIKSIAESFVCDLGYADGDELPWGIVKPLRAAGLVYTHNQGVDDESEDVPALDPTRVPELSKTEAAQLLSYLEQRSDIPVHVLEQLRSKTTTEASPTSDSSNLSLRDLLERNTADTSWVEESEDAIADAIHTEIGTDVSVEIVTEERSSSGIDLSSLVNIVGEKRRPTKRPTAFTSSKSP
jgi:hypothetical protein